MLYPFWRYTFSFYIFCFFKIYLFHIGITTKDLSSPKFHSIGCPRNKWFIKIGTQGLIIESDETNFPQLDGWIINLYQFLVQPYKFNQVWPYLTQDWLKCKFVHCTLLGFKFVNSINSNLEPRLTDKGSNVPGPYDHKKKKMLWFDGIQAKHGNSKQTNQTHKTTKNNNKH